MFRNLGSYIEQRRREARIAAQNLRTVDYVDLTNSSNTRERESSTRANTHPESTRLSNNINRRTTIHYESRSSSYSSPTDPNRDQRAEITINLDNAGLSNNTKTSIKVASNGHSRDISVSVQNNDCRDSAARDPPTQRRSQNFCHVQNEVPIVINGSSDEETSRTNERRSKGTSSEDACSAPSSAHGPPQKRARLSKDKGGRELSCPICFVDLLDSNVKSMVTPCGHMFCLECMKTMSNNVVMRCSMCRKRIHIRSCTLVHL